MILFPSYTDMEEKWKRTVSLCPLLSKSAPIRCHENRGQTLTLSGPGADMAVPALEGRRGSPQAMAVPE